MNEEEKSERSKYFDKDELKKKLGEQADSVLKMFQSYSKSKKAKETQTDKDE